MSDELRAEINAMTKVGEALSDLEDESRARVLHWALSRFGSGPTTTSIPAASAAPVEGESSASGGGEPRADEFEDLASLYDAATPANENEKALVCAYWFQEIQGFPDLTAQAINTELKHLGHGVSNITRTFDRLKNQKPALIVQTRKEGKTQQARKRFKLTGEGRKLVRQMLAHDAP